MAISTSQEPPLNSDHDFERLHVTRLSDCSRCASSKPTEVVAAVAKMQSQYASPLFRLPAELRAMIYSYVYVAKEPTFHEQGLTISEARSAKPASDLLRTCQIIFQEAHYTFEVARTKYWSKTVNVIHIHLKPVPKRTPGWDPRYYSFRDYKSLARDRINELHDRELEHIQEVVITVKYARPELTMKWRLSSCCRQSNDFHKLDWMLSRSSGSSRPKLLSKHIFTILGRSERSDSLINMLGHLCAYHCMVLSADVDLLSSAVAGQGITPSYGQVAPIQDSSTITSTNPSHRAPFGSCHFHGNITPAAFSPTSPTSPTPPGI